MNDIFSPVNNGTLSCRCERRDTLLAISAVFLDDIVLNFNEKNLKKKSISQAGQDGRSDEDKQTIFFWP